MATPTEPCDACGEPIDPTLRACPECGNDPAAAAKKSALGLTGIGVLAAFVVPVVGALLIAVGLLVLVVLWRGWADYSPTSHDF